MIAVGMGFKWFIFIVMAISAIGSALMMATRKNPVHSALWLVVTFFSIAVIYVLLNATFIAVAQVMVYAGAIMMLTLFIIMLIHLEQGPSCLPVKRSFLKLIGGIITLTLLLQIIAGIRFYANVGKKGVYTPEMLASVGNTAAVGSLLYGKYAFVFEIASVLLLLGIVGAVVLARKRKDEEE
ncbi:MAG TPA: NADH-quinone oxidoreductase subunit J [Syntrophorhabdaceae bacterium]|nr:NADH-quinone oxidoreductase subunit J [Syntrophorhabdaceae bacterium]